MKNVGNSSDGRSQGVTKISGHPCRPIGRMGALRGHLCDSTAFLFVVKSCVYVGYVCPSVVTANFKSLLLFLFLDGVEPFLSSP